MPDEAAPSGLRSRSSAHDRLRFHSGLERKKRTMNRQTTFTSRRLISELWRGRIRKWAAIGLASGLMLACGERGGGNGGVIDGGGPTGTDEPPLAEVQADVAADGESRPGVLVTLHQSDSADPVATRTTDVDGEVRFTELEPGSYDVSVDLLPDLAVPPDENTRKSVTAPAGQRAVVSFELAVIGPPVFGEVRDIDANTYRTVEIGGQTWMAENLRVTRFRNGDPVSNARTVDEWRLARIGASPAWANFANEPANGESYGKLYNDFAAVDPRGLCPDGWHVPTAEEWNVLERFIGIPPRDLRRNAAFRGDRDAVGKLKSTREEPDSHPRWNRPNVGGTNRTGFSALPSGYRVGAPKTTSQVEGRFQELGEEAPLWTSTPEAGGHVAFATRVDRGGIYRNFASGFGFGVRCVEG